MARLKNSTFGELSGKLGGNVFSRNKAGAYVRANVKPTNPKTGLQIAQRALFGQNTRIFGALNSADKTAWQEFADNIYSPKKGSNTGQFSGYNAFMSLRNAVNQARRVKDDSFTIEDQAGSPITVTNVPYTQMPNPPLAVSFSGVYTDSNDNPVGEAIIDAEVTINGECSFTLQIGDGSGTDLGDLLTVEDYEVGYVAYISNGKRSEGEAVSNRFAHLIGATIPVTADTPTELSAIESLKFSMPSSDFDIGNARRFPLKDEWVTLSVYAINKYGQLAQIDSAEVQVTDALA